MRGMTQHQPIDFGALARSLLDRADTLMPQWLPNGRRRGRYWYCGDFDGGAGKSANVDLVSGAWIDNANPDDRGGDLISLYCRVRRLPTRADAARELIGDTGWRSIAVMPAKPKRDPQWLPLHPVPHDAPPYRTQWGHYARGVPDASWEYRGAAGELLGVTCRFNRADGSKDVHL